MFIVVCDKLDAIGVKSEIMQFPRDFVSAFLAHTLTAQSHPHLCLYLQLFFWYLPNLYIST